MGNTSSTVPQGTALGVSTQLFIDGKWTSTAYQVFPETTLVSEIATAVSAASLVLTQQGDTLVPSIRGPTPDSPYVRVSQINGNDDEVIGDLQEFLSDTGTPKMYIRFGRCASGSCAASGGSVNIMGIADNGDGTSIWTFSDGSTAIVGTGVGPQGPQGIQGVSITTIVSHPTDGTITINLSDGSSVTTGSFTGPQGAQGIPGVPGAPGADGAVATSGTYDAQTGQLTFTFPDNSTVVTDDLRGLGISMVVDNPLDYTVILTNGNSFVIPKGQDGADGQDAPGNYVASVVDEGNGAITFTFSQSAPVTVQTSSTPPVPTGEMGTEVDDPVDNGDNTATGAFYVNNGENVVPYYIPPATPAQAANGDGRVNYLTRTDTNGAVLPFPSSAFIVPSWIVPGNKVSAFEITWDPSIYSAVTWNFTDPSGTLRSESIFSANLVPADWQSTTNSLQTQINTLSQQIANVGQQSQAAWTLANQNRNDIDVLQSIHGV